MSVIFPRLLNRCFERAFAFSGNCRRDNEDRFKNCPPAGIDGRLRKGVGDGFLSNNHRAGLDHRRREMSMHEALARSR